MSKPVLSSNEKTLTVAGQLAEMSKLDTLYNDLYLDRARALLSPVFSRGLYLQLEENKARIPWLEQQLRAAVERGEWERCTKMTEQLRHLKASVAAGAGSAKFAEAIYMRAGEIAIDPFASGLNAITGVTSEDTAARRNEALNILATLKRNDAEKQQFYSRRISDFKRLSIVTSDTNAEQSKEARFDPGQAQQAALSALDSGDFSKLDQMIATLSAKSAAERAKPSSVEVKTAEVAELGDDLLFTFTEQTLAAARELGLSPLRSESRRKFAYLIPHGWQPSFRKEEVRKWSEEKLSRMTYPEGTTDGAREAIDFFLLNPFITSAGTRYKVCLVAEDLLLEDFTEPETKAEVPTKLLDRLGLQSRWGNSRVEIEHALQEHGLKVLDELQLDPEAFRLVAIPADLYTHLGPKRGWGQKEMWTHYDGYRVLDGGKLQALAGGDNRFGGTHDVVSFSANYSSAKIISRFAVVQRKRMMDWQTG
jgi:hypothetical protein